MSPIKLRELLAAIAGSIGGRGSGGEGAAASTGGAARAAEPDARAVRPAGLTSVPVGSRPIRVEIPRSARDDGGVEQRLIGTIQYIAGFVAPSDRHRARNH